MTTRSRGGICCSLVTVALLALPVALPAQVTDSSYSIVALTAPRPENVIRSGIENARADEQEAARSDCDDARPPDPAFPRGAHTQNYPVAVPRVQSVLKSIAAGGPGGGSAD